MNPKRQAKPSTIVGMVVAIIAAVAFAAWNIQRSMAPTPAPATAANAPPPPTTASAPAPGAQTPSASAPAPDGPVVTASAPSGRSGEEELAPGADPFGQRLPEPTPIQKPGGPQVSAPPAYPPNTLPGQAERVTAGQRYPGLPPLGPAPVPSVRPSAGGPMQLLGSAPQLVGTLTGDLPSAVFKGDRQLAIVSVGDVFDGWRVVEVSHSGAVVKGFGRIVRLRVGAVRSAAVPPGPEAMEEVAEATPNATYDGSGRLVQGIAVDPPDAEAPADSPAGRPTRQQMAAQPDDGNGLAAHPAAGSDRKILRRGSEIPARVASLNWFVHAEGLLQREAERNAAHSQGTSTGATQTTRTSTAQSQAAAKPATTTRRHRRHLRKRIRRHRTGRYHRYHRIRRYRHIRRRHYVYYHHRRYLVRQARYRR